MPKNPTGFTPDRAVSSPVEKAAIPYKPPHLIKPGLTLGRPIKLPKRLPRLPKGF